MDLRLMHFVVARPLAIALGVLASCAGAPAILAADTLDYAPVDSDIAVVRLDTAPSESFLAVRADSTGRLFVGGREALFVYDLDAQGGYLPRREILRMPNHT